MWRSSLRLAARPVRHFRQFKLRRSQWDAPVRAVDSLTYKPNVARNLAFATGSTCIFFTGGAIYMYEDGFFDGEDVTQKPKTRKKSSSHNSWREAWNRLAPYHKQFTVIFGINAVIYAMWKNPRLAPFMSEYFARSALSPRVTPMLLSVFSHNSFLYLSLNMLTLYIFIGPATTIIGNEQFLVTYLTAGLVSSVAAHFVKCYRRIPTISMGAGGAVLGIMTLVSCAAPEGQLYISVLPSFFPPFVCSISHTLKTFVLVDILGMVMRWRFFDHTARLAGVLFSVAYVNLGYKFHQWYTDKVVDIWDRFRTRGANP